MSCDKCKHTVVDSCINQIQELIPEAALYEQLAEECSELAQACLKKARKLRDENYTPKTMEEIDANLEEEYTDVRLAAETCGLTIDWNLARTKSIRWIERNKNTKFLVNNTKEYQ